MIRRQPAPTNHPTLLFVADNPYIFDSSLAPLVEQLAPHFEIWVVAADFYMPRALRERLDGWLLDDTIRGFEILSFFVEGTGERSSPWRSHRLCAAAVERLPLSRCDVVVAHQNIAPWSPYFLRNLHDRCVRVWAISSTASFILDDPAVMEAFRNGVSARSALALGVSNQRSRSVLARLRESHHKNLARASLSAARRRMRAGYLRWADGRASALSGRPGISRAAMDPVTGIDPADFEVVLTQQPETVGFLGDMFPSSQVFAVTSPLAEFRATPHSEPSRTAAVLVLLPYVTATDAERILPGLARDLVSVCRVTGLSSFHLRSHPRSPGATTHTIQSYLGDNGLSVEVPHRSGPVWEIVQGYSGVVGPASSGLLEAAYALSDGFVVGLEDASQTYSADPRHLAGESESSRWLTWINADGSFDEGVFHRRPLPDAGPPMKDVICSLAGVTI